LIATCLASAGEAEISVERSDPDAIIFTIRFDTPETREVILGGRSWLDVDVRGCDRTDQTGWPEVPVRTLLLGIPPQAVVSSVDVKPLRTTYHGGAPIRPVPSPISEPGNRLAPRGWAIEPAWNDAEAGRYPARHAELRSVSWWRNRRVARLELSPVRTRPGAGGFEFVSEMRVHVQLRSTSSPSRKSRAARYGDDRLDTWIDRQLINGPQSRDWLRSESPRYMRGVADYFSSASNWMRIETEGEGITRVTAAELQAAGASGTIDATTLRLFVGSPLELSSVPPDEDPDNPPWMTELPILVEDGDDGELDGNDRIEFYTQPVDGYHDDLVYGSEDTTYVMHQYTDVRVYFLAWGGSLTGDPKRLTDTVEIVTPDQLEDDTLVESVTQRVHFELNRHFDGSPRENNIRWEKWWWNTGFRRTDGSWRIAGEFGLPGHKAGSEGSLFFRFWGATDNRNGSLPDHMVDTRINGNELARQEWEGLTRHDTDTTGTWFIENGNDFRVLVYGGEDPHYPDSVVVRLDRVYLAFLEIRHERELGWTGDDLIFRAPSITGDVRYRIVDLPDTLVDVYDITNPNDPILLLGGTFTSEGARYRLEFERNESPEPPSRYIIAPESRRMDAVDIMRRPPPIDAARFLRELREPIDYIIVYHEDFAASATALKALREQVIHGLDDPQVLAVPVQDVYDEFSWGLPDPTAIRNFFKFAYENYRDPGQPTEPRLAYGVLIGDADLDHRDFANANEVDYIPAWSERYDASLADDYEASWPSDDYLGLFDGPNTDYTMEISVGRIPAQTTVHSSAIVDKTVTHALTPDRGAWVIRSAIIADDLCQRDQPDGLQWTHTSQAESLCDTLPSEVTCTKIYLVEYPDPVTGTECRLADKTAARDALLNAINDGVWLVDYVGHGGETVMADERVLESPDVPSMKNDGRYFYFITASCSVGKFDAVHEGLGETIVKQAGGGSVASYSAAAVAYSGSNIRLNRSLLSSFFAGESTDGDSLRTIGESAVLALALAPGNNSHKYNVLGDPASVMVWPKYDAEIELVVDDAPPAPEDAEADTTYTLWRGQVVTVRGTITDDDDLHVSNFSGTSRLEVFDSALFRDREDVAAVDYHLPGAPIYRGDVSVENGQFETQFVVPTGLRRGAKGHAEIRCYVTGSGNDDALGHIVGITIPDTLKAGTVLDDVDGPTIALNFDGSSEAVPFGSSIDVSLEDDSGIYITELLDAQSVILTFEEPGNYVVSIHDLAADIVFEDGFRQADVSVPIPSLLEAGRPYLVKVRASDNLGNRSTLSQEIYLVASSEPELERVHVYPNPARDSAGFFVDFNVPSDIEVTIYSITGRQIKKLQGFRPAGVGRREPIVWDLRDEDLDLVANGSYLYVMDITPADGSPSHRRQGWVAVLR